MTAAVTGERDASPAHCERWLASPSPSRTRVRTAKMPMVLRP